MTMRMMKKHEAQPASTNWLLAILTSAAIFLGGCEGTTEERDENDGEIINSIVLPTDVVLNFYCADVGIYRETCVLQDPKDQVLFLKHNLNAQAIASIQGTAEGINRDIQSLIKEMENSISEANAFINQMGGD